MTRARLPEASDPSPVLDPCCAARCGSCATTAVVLRLGGRDRAVRLCAAHAARRRTPAEGRVPA